MPPSAPARWRTQARIAETLAVVEVAAAVPPTWTRVPDAHALPQGMVFDLTAEQSVGDGAVADLLSRNDCLRDPARQGVDLGKAGWVAHRLAYLRSGTAATC